MTTQLINCIPCMDGDHNNCTHKNCLCENDNHEIKKETIEISKKEYYIELFRKYNFNCFPIPQYPKAYKEHKGADGRYKGSKTILNQTIHNDENYGILPTIDGKNAIIDLDDKERYRKFADDFVKQGFMVIESPHGWHIPVVNLTGLIQKVELFDYNVKETKIIEIQGFDHYVVGVESQIYDKETSELIFYKNKGTDKIFDANQKDFHTFIETICKKCSVEGKKRDSRSSYNYLRERFQKGLPPKKGTSNDYFFHSAIQCNTDGLDEETAIQKIREVYDKWVESDSFSDRPWSNIETKIREVYENGYTANMGRPKKNGIDRTKIAQNIIADKKMYSNVDTHEIFENKNGFLEKINNSLKKEIGDSCPNLEKMDYESILFKLEFMAKDIPKTNKKIMVFKDGTYDKKTKQSIITNDIADIGFREYNYLPKTKENEPTEFIKIMFDNVPKEEHSRIKAGLKGILESYLDSRISVICGNSGVGKSTGLNILVKVLGQYAEVFELDQITNDKFIRAKIKGLLLVVIQELPQEWKSFASLKALTGEQRKQERGFHQDSTSFDNKIKIWASGNYLSKIPPMEQNSMYERRLSLIHNTKTKAYKENPTLIDDISENEGEKIISWILNLDDKECQYESPETIKLEWERLASPETDYIEKYYTLSDNAEDVSVGKLVKHFKEVTGKTISIKQMVAELQEQGYIIKYNIIKNLYAKVLQTVKKNNKSVSDY